MALIFFCTLAVFFAHLEWGGGTKNRQVGKPPQPPKRSSRKHLKLYIQVLTYSLIITCSGQSFDGCFISDKSIDDLQLALKLGLHHPARREGSRTSPAFKKGGVGYSWMEPLLCMFSNNAFYRKFPTNWFGLPPSAGQDVWIKMCKWESSGLACIKRSWIRTFGLYQEELNKDMPRIIMQDGKMHLINRLVWTL